MMSPSSQTKSLSNDWKSWPRLPNRKPRRGIDPFCRMSHRHDDSKEQFLIDGVDEHHDQICAAIATAILPMGTDPKVRFGRFTYSTGPTKTPSMRIEYHEDEWTVFTADIWTSTNLDSMLIVVEHWSYLSGSWLGRHLLKHAEDSVFAVLATGFTQRRLFFTRAIIPWMVFAVLVGALADNPPGGLVLGPITLLGLTLMPYSRRTSSASATVQAQRHFVDRVRQCIYTALADLGIPSSAIHHSIG